MQSTNTPTLADIRRQLRNLAAKIRRRRIRDRGAVRKALREVRAMPPAAQSLFLDRQGRLTGESMGQAALRRLRVWRSLSRAFAPLPPATPSDGSLLGQRGWGFSPFTTVSG